MVNNSKRSRKPADREARRARIRALAERMAFPQPDNEASRRDQIDKVRAVLARMPHADANILLSTYGKGRPLRTFGKPVEFCRIRSKAGKTFKKLWGRLA